jgi:signal transduction histidine kinase
VTTVEPENIDKSEVAPGSVLARGMARVSRMSVPFHAAASLALVVVVGVADHLTGFERSFLVFYLIPIAWGAWFISRSYGIFLSILSFAFWLFGDLAAGASDSHSEIVSWNALVGLASFLVVVSLLSNLRRLLSQLEWRVLRRTAALSQEIAERARLEREVLEVSEREQSRIGRDLHDGLGQHLTGAALTCQLLRQRLAARNAEEVPDADHVVGMIEEAIEVTRSLAHGLSPVALEADGLFVALQDLRSYAARHFNLQCEFQGDEGAVVGDPAAATHLYRIAQEAITNAVRHGKATVVSIQIRREGERTVLTLTDNGRGINQESLRGRDGLGLRTMAHRAELMGATFRVERRPEGGTIVQCSLPLAGQLHQDAV